MKKGKILLLMLLLGISCKKEEKTPPLSLEEALTSNQWSFKRLIVSFKTGGAADLTSAYFRQCELDDLFVFGKDNVYKKSDAGIICDTQGNTTFTRISGARWSVVDSIFTIHANFETQIYKVSEWSRSKMIWQQTTQNFVGDQDIYNFEFARR